LRRVRGPTEVNDIVEMSVGSVMLVYGIGLGVGIFVGASVTAAIIGRKERNRVEQVSSS
jgi:hypothetical protein